MKIRRTKGRRSKGRRTRQRTKGRKMTGGGKHVAVSYGNIEIKIANAKRALHNKTKNADDLANAIDVFIVDYLKNNIKGGKIQYLKDWKLGELKRTTTHDDGTYNHDWFFVKENKNRAKAKGTDATE